MNIDVFIEELRPRFLPMGRLDVATTKNIPGVPSPRIDAIWFVETNTQKVNVHISGMQNPYPTVVVDVPSHLSLNYTLGTSTIQVMNNANRQYEDMPEELSCIEQYADLILDAYNVSVAYDKATMLYNQFWGTLKPECLQDAYVSLKIHSLNCTKCIQLFSAIKEASKSKGIVLP